MKTLTKTQDLMLGCDPEFFFKKDGEIIGSEKVIPEAGLVNFDSGNLVRDGVQAELNPKAMYCRAQLAGNIRQIFMDLDRHLQSRVGVSVDFSQVVEVSKSEMESLGEKSQTFGCAASKNAHLKTLDKISKIGVDPKVYMKRSAGGHIHLGMDYGYSQRPLGYAVARDPAIMIPILDIILGNTCVLLDRHEGNKERRKVYGRAGEYRTPAHGLEYRTLSNFWLRSPVLMSFVMGMARLAVQIVVESTDTDPLYKELMALVDMRDIEKAINNNDYDLALRNWRRIEDFLYNVIGEEDYSNFYPIHGSTKKQFDFFIKVGLDHFFTRDPMEVWIKAYSHYYFGDFIRSFVVPTVVSRIKKTI